MSIKIRSPGLDKSTMSVAERKTLAQTFPDRPPAHPVTRLRTIPSKEEEMQATLTRTAGPAPNELASSTRSSKRGARKAAPGGRVASKKSKVSRRDSTDTWKGGSTDTERGDDDESSPDDQQSSSKSSKVQDSDSEDGGLLLETSDADSEPAQSYRPNSSTEPQSVPSVTVTQNAPCLDALNHDKVRELQRFIQGNNYDSLKMDRRRFIAEDIGRILKIIWPKHRSDTWKTASDEDFFQVLLQAYPADDKTTSMSVEDRLRKIVFPPPYYLVNLTSWMKEVRDALHGEPSDESSERTWVQILIRQMGVNPERLHRITRSVISELEPKKSQITTIDGLFDMLYEIQQKYQNACQIAKDKVGMTYHTDIPPELADKQSKAASNAEGRWSVSTKSNTGKAPHTNTKSSQS